MKFDKSDVHLLFAPKPAASTGAAAPPATFASEPPESPPSPAQLTAPASPAHEPGEEPSTKTAAALHQVLKSVVPTLYRKVGQGALSKRERRERLFQLLNWFCQKRGYEFHENVKQPYVFRHAKVEGRLQALVARGSERVVLEVCYELDAAALAKLRNAYLHGKHPLLVWLGAHASATELLARITLLTDCPAGSWLDVVVLDAPVQAPK